MSAEDRQKWDQRYQAADFEVGSPSAVVQRLIQRMLASLVAENADPAGQAAAHRHRLKVLDVAAGAGRHSVWLAQQGWDVTALDISAPGLELAAARARDAGVPLNTFCLDLDEAPLPTGPWDLVLTTMFVDRTLPRRAVDVLSDIGCFVYVQPTQKNLERHAKPPADFLLLEGELPGLIAAAGLELLHYEEGWLEDGRHDACCLARRAAKIATASPRRR